MRTGICSLSGDHSERAAGTAFRAVACILAAARSSGGKEVKTWNADGGFAAAD